MLTDANADLFQKVSTLKEFIKLRLMDREAPAAVGVDAELESQIIFLREMMIRRIAGLGDDACSGLEQRDVIRGISTTKSLLETAAILHHLCEQTRAFARNREDRFSRQELDDLCNKLARFLTGSATAPNPFGPKIVFAAVSKLSRQLKGIRWQYDALVEFLQAQNGRSLVPPSNSRPANKGIDYQINVTLSTLLSALTLSVVVYDDIADAINKIPLRRPTAS